MPARKRDRQEAGLDSSIVTAHVEVSQENETLTKLRNMWQFAAFMQYLFLFGRVVKVEESFDMDEFELECLRPDSSPRLQEVGLALLKYVSSHRGLTMDIFDEYTRRQYMAKAPTRNPFGEDDEPIKFLDLDVFTKVRVLHQLSVWTLGNADRIRQQMAETTEREQTSWRIEELGWDRDERAYYLLDDDRLYRRTDAPLPPTPKKSKAKPKAKPKPKPTRSRGTRSSKRQKLLIESEGEDEQEEEVEEESQQDAEIDDFGGMKWECVAVTLQHYQDFVESIRRSSDANEKQLRKRIMDQIMPVMEEKAEKQRQKALKKQRDLENLQKLATAKRSSRIAGRQEMAKQKEEEEAAEKKRLADLTMAKKEQEKQRKMEEARETRMLTREQRLKEREVKRILHEEELKKLEENSKKMDGGEGRMSERNLKLEMEKRQKELDKLAEEEDQWMFDCSVCGMHGENLDDGTHSIACEKCNIWQHSKCHGISEENAERDDFHFVCNDCVRREDEGKKPRIPPLRLRMGASNSPQLDRAQPYHVVDATHPYDLMDGPALSPSGQSPGPPGYHPRGPSPVGVPQQAWNGSALPPPPRPMSSGYASSPPRPRSNHFANGHAASPPPLQLHQQAHASALSSSDLPHPFHHYQPPVQHNGNGLSMLPPSPQKGHSRPSSAYDQAAASRSPLNGSILTPHHQNHHQIQPLSYSPNTSFPPPSRPQHHQQAAGHSPTKPPSSSPVHAGQQSSMLYGTPSNPQQQQHHSVAMHSSPIPPLPTGNTPIIPQKHDTPRPASRDSVGPIPPGIKMSPSPASFARPGSSSAIGGPSQSANQSFRRSFGTSFGSQSHQLGTSGDGASDDAHVRSGGGDVPRSSVSTNHQHPQRTEDGGVAGVETEFGEGSVPVKKMPPPQSSPPPPASPFSTLASQKTAGLQPESDTVMRDP